MTAARSFNVPGMVMPNVVHYPFDRTTMETGIEVCEWLPTIGITLMDWQNWHMMNALAERVTDHKWAAFEVGSVAPRQNGKTELFKARELAGLYLFDEGLITHSAHRFPTARETFEEVKAIINMNPDLAHKTKFRELPGEKIITNLETGGRCQYVARSGGNGRGFSGEVLMLDEAWKLSAEDMADAMPTLATLPNPQVWYGSSAGKADSVVLANVRKKARNRTARRLFYADYCAPGNIATVDVTDRALWALANPSMGQLISEEFIESEMGTMTRETFARERLGIWDEDSVSDTVFDNERFVELMESEPRTIVGNICLGIHVSRDRSRGAIAVGGFRADTFPQVEIVAHNNNPHEWLFDKVVDIVKRRNCKVILDAGSGAASFVKPLQDAIGEDNVILMNTVDIVRSCGMLHSAISSGKMRWYGPNLDLQLAVSSVVRKFLRDSWLYDADKTTADITPLYAATFAHWGTQTMNLSPADPKRSIW